MNQFSSAGFVHSIQPYEKLKKAGTSARGLRLKYLHSYCRLLNRLMILRKCVISKKSPNLTR